MEKIYSITEAFSMQPKTFSVLTEEQHNETLKWNTDFASQDCKEIKFETLTIGRLYGDPVEELYYVGYNFEDVKIFQFLAKSVNVTFK